MEQSGSGTRLDQISDLLAYLEVDTLGQASDALSEHTDPDVSIVEEDGGHVVRMGAYGCVLDFPTTVADVWELLHDLERDVAAAVESEFEEDA